MEHLYKETPEDRMKKIEAIKEQFRHIPKYCMYGINPKPIQISSVNHMDVFELAGYDEEQSKILWKLCLVYNLDPYALLRVINDLSNYLEKKEAN